MQHTIFVNFRNTDMAQSAQSRMNQIILPLYWNIENFALPDDWDNFGGEVEVQGLQDKGGDNVKLTAPSYVIAGLLNHFSKTGEHREVRSIEIPASQDAIREFKQYISKNEIAEFERHGQPSTFRLDAYATR